MNRFSRVNTIWRKELIDILRDRRTIVAMVLVPIILYPALMLGSLQAMQAQHNTLLTDTYRVYVLTATTRQWLRHLIDTDPVRRPAPSSAEGGAAETDEDTPDSVAAVAQSRPAAEPEEPQGTADRAPEEEHVRRRARTAPPKYKLVVLDPLAPGSREALFMAWFSPLEQLLPRSVAAQLAGEFAGRDYFAALRRGYSDRVLSGDAHSAIIVEGRVSDLRRGENVRVNVILDNTDERSSTAGEGLLGILDRENARLVDERLRNSRLSHEFLTPVISQADNVAPREKVGGRILGQILPLILIIMTITGAIYPAIDLTAGERERGTLETLMVAPVATGELIAGKFIVVTLVSMISATLNLLSVGGTIYFGGLGDLLTGGDAFVIPLWSLPLVLAALIPLAVMFSAALLAVCSFARSFKEAQNYVMPVMVAAMIPAVIGILPATRLQGATLVMPVANIVVLSRELFLGHTDPTAILWVISSTCIYAGAAVAVAAKLFGQEAVLFADSGSIKTIFQRRYFKPTAYPTAASALLLAAIVFPLHFFLLRAISESELFYHNERWFYAVWALFILVFVGTPIFSSKYMRVNEISALSLRRPPAAAWAAALILGASTWVLGLAWAYLQQSYVLPMPPAMIEALKAESSWFDTVPLWLVVFVIGMTAGVCEEIFFRGYVLSGLRSSLRPLPAVLVMALIFGLFHHSPYRLILQTALGVLLGVLAWRSGSVWPGVLVHVMHNSITVLVGEAAKNDALRDTLANWGLSLADENSAPAMYWVVAGAVGLAIGVAITLSLSPPARTSSRRQTVVAQPAIA